jgi:hypothetical protein
MGLFLVTFGVMALAVFGMAIGVVFGRAPIAGSCGGLNSVDDSGECQSCSRPCSTSRRKKRAQDKAAANSNTVAIRDWRDSEKP